MASSPSRAVPPLKNVFVRHSREVMPGQPSGAPASDDDERAAGARRDCGDQAGKACDVGVSAAIDELRTRTPPWRGGAGTEGYSRSLGHDQKLMQPNRRGSRSRLLHARTALRNLRGLQQHALSVHWWGLRRLQATTSVAYLCSPSLQGSACVRGRAKYEIGRVLCLAPGMPAARRSWRNAGLHIPARYAASVPHPVRSGARHGKIGGDRAPARPRFPRR